MKFSARVMILALLLTMVAVMAWSQTRKDVVWARKAPAGSITLDGVMNESVWSVAESVQVVWGQVQSAYEPGSGYRVENGVATPTDPTNATVKFLVIGDSLYVGVYCRDKSIGGGLFNQFDGLLMNIRDRSKADRPTPSYEYFYGWVTEGWADTTLGGLNKLPGFFGWAGGKRTDSTGGVPNSQIWNAVTKVYGAANSDTGATKATAVADTAWSTELVFNLGVRGYDVTKAGGDIVMFNMSIYDSDYRWPLDTTKVAGNRTWLQGPWGNASAAHFMHIFGDPTVTTTSGAITKTVEPDFRIPTTNSALPTIDGNLNDAVWSTIGGFRITYGDNAVRNAYRYTLPYRSGQYQPDVWGKNTVLDPATATVKMFHKGDTLYVGVDVPDKVVQYVNSYDRQDGFKLLLKERSIRVDQEYNLEGRDIYVRVDSGATKWKGENWAVQMIADTLPTNATKQTGNKIAFALKSGTTVDTLGATQDAGYQIEMKINLRSFGYAAGLGDRMLYFGALINDGDTYGNVVPAYGNRAWLGHEGNWNAGPAVAYLDPNLTTSAEDEGAIPGEFRLFGSYPNPFNPEATIDFAIPVRSNVRVVVYDILGRAVDTQMLTNLVSGRHSQKFNGSMLSSGVYFYQIQLLDLNTNNVMGVKSGKMLLVK